MLFLFNWRLSKNTPLRKTGAGQFNSNLENNECARK